MSNFVFSPTAKAIAQAKCLAAEHMPYLACMLQQSATIETTAVPTMAVDGMSRLYVNPKFIASLSREHCAFILLHEMMHIVLSHAKRFEALLPADLRKSEANRLTWNEAADISINEMLVRDCKLLKPPFGCFLAGYEHVDGLELGQSTEHMYRLLLQHKQDQPQDQQGDQGEEANDNSGEPSVSGDDDDSLAGDTGSDSAEDNADSGDSDSDGNGSEEPQGDGGETGQADAEASPGGDESDSADGEGDGDADGEGSTSSAGTGAGDTDSESREDTNGSSSHSGSGDGKGRSRSPDDSDSEQGSKEPLDPSSSGSNSDGVKRDYEPEETLASTTVANATLSQVLQEMDKYEAAKGVGSVPARLRQSVEARLRRQPDPFKEAEKVVQTSFQSAAGQVLRTWRKLPRRGNRDGVLVMGSKHEQPEVSVIIDTSASMGGPNDDRRQRAITAVMQGLRRCKNPRVVCADCEIASVKQVRSMKDFTWDGGGGTDMRGAVEYVDREHRQQVIVLVTDGECDYPPEKPRAKLIVVLVDSGSYGVPDYAFRVIDCKKEATSYGA